MYNAHPGSDSSSMHDREAFGEEGSAELILVIRKALVGGPRVRCTQEGGDAASGG